MPIYFNSVSSSPYLLPVSFWIFYLEIQMIDFLVQVYHVDLRQAAWFSAVPWGVMAVMGYLAGMWSDILIQNGTSITLTRKIMQVWHFLV